MKSIIIAALLLGTAGAAQAQTAGQTGGPVGATAPNTTAGVAGGASASASMAKPRGQIITLKSATDRKRVGVRAHCSDGTAYWDPKIEDSEYYCDGKDAPGPAPAAQ